MGEITEEKLEILKDADAIMREEFINNGLNQSVNQYFAVLTGIKSVGVMGDGRTYENTIALRAVTTNDFIDTYHGNYPLTTEQPERYKEYQDKWEQQKTYNYTFTDNMCDTYLWWRRIIFRDDV